MAGNRANEVVKAAPPFVDEAAFSATAVRATTAPVYDFVPLRVAHACLPAALGSLLGMPISKFSVISVSIYFTNG